jgi:hypothetical protein
VLAPSIQPRRVPTAIVTSVFLTRGPPGYFAILRLYGPTEAAINKSWEPGDIEKVDIDNPK